ncbi:hypothetical protein [Dyella silvae]|uniref:hypothetical protein n=1 Tax=Dyella silvae TaxID=2994424 RepID=UPI0022652E97|nr:hypothetical protein [Dyella silvae]
MQAWKEKFEEVAHKWICDGYSSDVRFVARKQNHSGKFEILCASVGFMPLPLDTHKESSFQVNIGDYFIGQIVRNGVTQDELYAILNSALSGEVQAYGIQMELHDRENAFVSGGSQDNEWFQLLSARTTSRWKDDNLLHKIYAHDDGLRRCPVPFDGASDLMNWLGFQHYLNQNSPPVIEIHVASPVDISLSDTKLAGGKLNVQLIAHPMLDTDSVRLALRVTPDKGVSLRKQLANKVRWGRTKNGRRIGRATVAMHSAEGALLMLSVDDKYVRRHWWVDPSASRNERYLAVQQFDPELKRIKHGLLETGESQKFELAVAALLYLLGFNPCVQLETQSPDIVVITPGGQIAIVECTLRTADVATKVGKLVDRREQLARIWAATRRGASVLSILVCQTDRSQVSATDVELAQSGVLLITRQWLSNTLITLRSPNDPDLLYQSAKQRLSDLIKATNTPRQKN